MKETDNKISSAPEAQNTEPSVVDEKFLDGEMFSNMVRGGAAQLRANAEEVNNLKWFNAATKIKDVYQQAIDKCNE